SRRQSGEASRCLRLARVACRVTSHPRLLRNCAVSCSVRCFHPREMRVQSAMSLSGRNASTQRNSTLAKETREETDSGSSLAAEAGAGKVAADDKDGEAAAAAAAETAAEAETEAEDAEAAGVAELRESESAAVDC